MTDQFGNELKVGDWVYFASTYGGSTAIRKGRIYGLVEDVKWHRNNMVKLETYKKSLTNSTHPCNPLEEMQKQTVKVTLGAWNCALAKEQNNGQ